MSQEPSQSPSAANAPTPSNAQKHAKTTAFVAAILGLIVATGVVGYFNVGAIWKAMQPIGGVGFAAAIAAQIAIFVPLGAAWMLVAAGSNRRTAIFMWARLLREAASDVLPFSQIGGLVIAGRAAVLGGVSTAVATASSIVDMTVEILAQIIYTLVGVVLLVERMGIHDRLFWPLVEGCVVGVCIVAGLVVTQRQGFAVIERKLAQIVPAAAEQAAAIGEEIHAAYARPVRLAGCLALHVVGWFAAAAGTWLILLFIGHPLPFLSVVGIESLLFAIRNAAFMAPSGLGVQEGAYALLGPLFGLPAEAALALSLLKRGRDICIGVPMLLSWQVLENRRVLRRA